MATKQRVYRINERDIPALITYKRMRSMTLRYDAEKGMFKVSAPFLTPTPVIDDFVMRHAEKLLRRIKKRASPYDGQYLYFLGEKVEVGELSDAQVVAYYKKNGMAYLKKRVEEFTAIMKVPVTYNVRMRNMRRTYGSNSKKTQTLTFQAKLLAYAPEIVDSVIIHELAHYFAFDHSKKFYRVVYSYCPNYDSLRKKLIHDQYQG